MKNYVHTYRMTRTYTTTVVNNYSQSTSEPLETLIRKVWAVAKPARQFGHAMQIFPWS